MNLLIKVTPDNRGNFGPPEDNLPVYSRDVNQCIEAIEGMDNLIAFKRINLKNELPNVFDWNAGRSAGNTFPSFVAVKWVSGNYSLKIIPEIAATTTIVFDITKFPSDLGLSYALRVFVGDIEIFAGGEPAGFATNADWMDFVKTKFEDAGYGVVIDTLNMELTGATGLGATINGKTVEVASRDENASTFTDSLSSSSPFSGGVDAASTDFKLKLNDLEMVFYPSSDVKSVIQFVDETRKICYPVLNINNLPLFSTSGYWSLPVTTGTQDDFIIDIIILGSKIN